MNIDIVLVDDHLSFRAGLRKFLGQQPGFTVVAEADHGGQLDEALCSAGVILMDVDMPGLAGIGATRRAIELAPRCRVLALSNHDDPGFVDAMLKAGAQGYMLKDDPLDELVQAVREVAAGRPAFSRALLASMPTASGWLAALTVACTGRR